MKKYILFPVFIVLISLIKFFRYYCSLSTWGILQSK